jgi:flagellar hook protein FlgE
MLRIPLTGLMAASKDLSAVSNNLANASTTGFKKSSAEFGDIMASAMEGRPGVDAGLGANTIDVKRSTEQGSFQQTGNSLDLALQGGGYFVFGDSLTTQGEANLSYSRAGSLTLNPQGYLVDQGGAPVMGNTVLAGGLVGANLQPINLFSGLTDPTQINSISVDNSGIVSVTTADGTTKQVASLALARFENEDGLQDNGNSKFSPTGSSGAALYGRAGTDGFATVSAGNLENSNVDVTSELLRMIQDQQAYNGNSRALQTGSDMIRSLTEQMA